MTVNVWGGGILVGETRLFGGRGSWTVLGNLEDFGGRWTV